MTHEDDPKLTADLRVTLSQVFALGYLDAMAGFEVKEDDLIASEDAAGIEALALAYIELTEDVIHANYIENPQMVHDGMYVAGRLAYSQVERRAIQRN